MAASAERRAIRAVYRPGDVPPTLAIPVPTVLRHASKFSASQGNPNFYKMIDVARRIAGTGSLGVDRYVILVEGKGSPDNNYLLDLKEALPSVVTPHVKTPQPHWDTEAARVVAVQQRAQAVSQAFLHADSSGSLIFAGMLIQRHPSTKREFRIFTRDFACLSDRCRRVNYAHPRVLLGRSALSRGFGNGYVHIECQNDQ